MLKTDRLPGFQPTVQPSPSTISSLLCEKVRKWKWLSRRHVQWQSFESMYSYLLLTVWFQNQWRNLSMLKTFNLWLEKLELPPLLLVLLCARSVAAVAVRTESTCWVNGEAVNSLVTKLNLTQFLVSLLSRRNLRELNISLDPSSLGRSLVR